MFLMSVIQMDEADVDYIKSEVWSSGWYWWTFLYLFQYESCRKWIQFCWFVQNIYIKTWAFSFYCLMGKERKKSCDIDIQCFGLNIFYSAFKVLIVYMYILNNYKYKGYRNKCLSNWSVSRKKIIAHNTLDKELNVFELRSWISPSA